MVSGLLTRQTIGEIKTPFSIGDFLERVVPGFILIFVLAVMIVPGKAWSLPGTNDLVRALFWIAASYPVGVALNFLSRLVPWANQRAAVDIASDNMLQHIKKAVETFFGITATADSWRYCFGIVTKHGYSFNVDLFARLDIFCRSMMVSSGIVFVTISVLAPFGHLGWNMLTVLLSLAAASGAFFIFLYSARTYSRAFVSAIYEGFYSWYTETRLSPATP